MVNLLDRDPYDDKDSFHQYCEKDAADTARGFTLIFICLLILGLMTSTNIWNGENGASRASDTAICYDTGDINYEDSSCW